jgi:hypothetical protein
MFSRHHELANIVQGEIGVLDRKDMDSFAGIFVAYQKRGKSDNKEGGQLPANLYYQVKVRPPFAVEIAALDKQLAPWNSHDAPGKRRADSDHDTFSVK